MMERLLGPSHLPDTNQSAWQLASIQLSGMVSLPVLTSSVLLLRFNNFYNTLLTILLGNIIVFFIRMSIIAMSYKKRENTVELARGFLGRIGGYTIAVFLLLSSVIWFIVQTTEASRSLTYLVPVSLSPDTNTFIQISVILGVVSTLFCLEGMILLRRLAGFAFPILIVAFIMILFSAPHIALPKFSFNFSLAGLAIVLATNLGVSVDLPTFFRHSHSWNTSVRALIIIQICNLLTAFAGLYLGAILDPLTGLAEKGGVILQNFTLRSSLTALIFFSAICANVANVYSASVGWELIAPGLAGKREYLILGFGMTVLFILITNVFSLNFTLDAIDSSMVNLCLVLVIAYVIYLLLRRPPTESEKRLYFLAWLVATTVNVVQVLGFFRFDDSIMITGLSMIVSVILLGFSGKMLVYIFKK